MAKFDVSQITEMLNEADSNKALLNDLASAVQKYVNNQMKQLEDIQVLLDNARAGKLSGKSKRGAKGGVVGNAKADKPEIKDKSGKVLDKRSKEYKERYAAMEKRDADFTRKDGQ